MNETIPANIVDAFGNAARVALKTFPYTELQCVGLSAWIADRINRQGICCKVALGTLRCNGRYAFKYSGPIPKKPKNSFHWDGHAWVEFEHRIIGDASLCRSARALPDVSNLKNHLGNLNVLHLGALMFPYIEADKKNGLKYVRKSYLHDEVFPIVISALEALNETN